MVICKNVYFFIFFASDFFFVVVIFAAISLNSAKGRYQEEDHIET